MVVYGCSLSLMVKMKKISRMTSHSRSFTVVCSFFLVVRSRLRSFTVDYGRSRSFTVIHGKETYPAVAFIRKHMMKCERLSAVRDVVSTNILISNFT